MFHDLLLLASLSVLILADLALTLQHSTVQYKSRTIQSQRYNQERRTTRRQHTFHPFTWRSICVSVRILLPPSRNVRHCCQIQRLRTSYPHGMFLRWCSAITGTRTYLRPQQCNRPLQLALIYRSSFLSRSIGYSVRFSSRWEGVLAKDGLVSSNQLI